MNVTGITPPAGLMASDISAKPAPLTATERARAIHLRGAALHHASGPEQRAAVAAQFEAILVRQMLNKTVTSMLGKQDSAASSVYGDLMTEALANNLTAGPGIGLAGMLEKQLAPRAAAHGANATPHP